MIFSLPGACKTLSTSALNGGIRRDLHYLLNINCQAFAYESEMTEDTYEKELQRQIRELTIDPAKATALSTAAWTELAVVNTQSFRDLTVSATASGGIDHNAVAPGDPAGYYEENGQYTPAPPGTVNIFLWISKPLTDAALLRALMICTEAKASAIQELLIGSCYSSNIATGSGTDGCILAAPLEQEGSDNILTDASGHSKLGELIGTAVKEAVRGALLRQTAANGARQFKLLTRVQRYDITLGSLYDFYLQNCQRYHGLGVRFDSVTDFERQLTYVNQSSNLVVITSLYVHLLDQAAWGLIMPGEVLREGRRLMMDMLYISPGRFLKDMYPEKAFIEETLIHEGGEGPAPAIRQLMHLLLLYLGCLSRSLC